MIGHLYHVSEDPGIARFVPQPPPSAGGGIADNVVWAVDEAHLVNYLLPRDCPRVTFRAGARTTAADRRRYLGDPAFESVVAVEARWLSRISTCRLFLYCLPRQSFQLADPIAGYYVSRHTVAPRDVTELTDAVHALRARRAELRVLEELWSLRDAVAASTLDFSIIRMRNAAPRSAPASPPTSR